MSFPKMFEKIEDSCLPNGQSHFQWTAKNIGFGEFYFYENNQKLMCSNELMGKEFIKRMLCQMVDDCELDCVSNNEDKS